MALKYAVLISGRGSNLQALAAACQPADWAAEIVLVVSDTPHAPGLDWAHQEGLKTLLIDPRKYPRRQDFEDKLHIALNQAGAEYIFLAGFMRLLSGHFVDQWHNRIINIHPSLLPAFPGLDTHRRVLEAGVRFTGATIHYVRARMDEGPIIAQAVVPVLPEDTVKRLEARVLAAEHRLYPHILGLIAQQKLHIQGDSVIMKEVEWPQTLLMAPFPP